MSLDDKIGEEHQPLPDPSVVHDLSFGHYSLREVEGRRFRVSVNKFDIDTDGKHIPSGIMYRGRNKGYRKTESGRWVDQFGRSKDENEEEGNDPWKDPEVMIERQLVELFDEGSTQSSSSDLRLPDDDDLADEYRIAQSQGDEWDDVFEEHAQDPLGDSGEISVLDVDDSIGDGIPNPFKKSKFTPVVMQEDVIIQDDRDGELAASGPILVEEHGVLHPEEIHDSGRLKRQSEHDIVVSDSAVEIGGSIENTLLGEQGIVDNQETYIGTNDLKSSMDGEGEVDVHADTIQGLEPATVQMDSKSYEDLAKSRPKNSQLPFGLEVGRYTLESYITRGGMGEVWVALHEGIGEKHAMKLMTSVDPDAVEQFSKEIKIQAKLKHPNIIPPHDAGNFTFENNEWYYVTMDLLSEGDLKERVEREFDLWLNSQNIELSKSNPSTGEYIRTKQEWMKQVALHSSQENYEMGHWTIQKIVEIVRDTGIGLKIGHDNALVHRDVKPANIMFQEGVVKVTDWGLADFEKNLLGDNESDQSIKGTPQYMAPEQTSLKVKTVQNNATGRFEQGLDRKIDNRTDVYQLGAVLYDLVTGSKRHEHATAIHAIYEYLSEINERRDVKFAHEINDALDKDLSAIINKALQYEREDRYQSMQEMVDDLNRYLAGKPVNARQEGPLKYTWLETKKQHWKKYVAVAAGTLLLGALSIVGTNYLEQRKIIQAQQAKLEQEQRSLELLLEESTGLYNQANDVFRSRDSKDSEQLSTVKQSTLEAINKVRTYLSRDTENEAATTMLSNLQSNVQRLERELRETQLISFQRSYNALQQWTRTKGRNFETSEAEYTATQQQITQSLAQLQQLKDQHKDHQEMVTSIDAMIGDFTATKSAVDDLVEDRSLHYATLEQQRLQREQAQERSRRRTTATTELEQASALVQSTIQSYQQVPEWFSNRSQAQTGTQTAETNLTTCIAELEEAKTKVQEWKTIDSNLNTEQISQFLSQIEIQLLSVRATQSEIQKRKQAYAKLVECQTALSQHNYPLALSLMNGAIQLHSEDSMTTQQSQISTRLQDAIDKRSDWANYQTAIILEQYEQYVFRNIGKYDTTNTNEAQRLQQFKQQLGTQEFERDLTRRLLDPGNQQFINQQDPRSQEFTANDYTAFRHLGWTAQADGFQRKIRGFRVLADRKINEIVQSLSDSTRGADAVELNRRVSERAPLYGGLEQVWFSQNNGGITREQYGQYMADIREGRPLPARLLRKIDSWNLYRMWQVDGHGGLTQQEYRSGRELLRGSRGNLPQSTRDKINRFYMRQRD